LIKKILYWRDYITINIFWFGINTVTGSITPVILPFLIALYVPGELKNTYLANVRVASLAVAMMVQPIAGSLPYVFAGAILDILFLFLVGASTLFIDSPLDAFFDSNLGVTAAYAVLLISIILLQASNNIAAGALQGLIPDLISDDQRGRASGVKAVMELLPIAVVIAIGPLVDTGRLWEAIGVVMAITLITMLIAMRFVHEKPLKEKPLGDSAGPLLRLVALAAIFVGVSQASLWLVRSIDAYLHSYSADPILQVSLVGIAGFLAMIFSIIIGVYFGAWSGIGKQVRRQSSFIWWVISRLFFLTAIGSIQGFAYFFLRDIIQIPDSRTATMTSILLAAVALFLIPSALVGGYLSDRMGRRKLAGLSGLIAAGGTLALLSARDFPLVLIGGCIIGLATGLFYASNWALGTDLVPKREAGRYLGISNLAGAGAGIIGVGIGGPIADSINSLRPDLGYLIIFAIYAGLFLLSTLSLSQIRGTIQPGGGI
jgi:MFS family permease